MSTNTINYSLVKPELNETADIQVINDNMDIIDIKLKEIDNKASNITVPVTKVNNKTGDVVLTASDVGAAPQGHNHDDKYYTESEIDTKFESVESDLAKMVTKEIDYAVASGTNTYTATIADTTLVEGRSYKIKFTNANTGASTLNINSLGDKAIQKGNGNALSSGNIKAEQIVHLVYTGSVFQLLGEGGEYGTATKAQVLNTHTIATELGGIEQGLIPLKTAQTYTPTTVDQTISSGRYLSGVQTIKGDANLIANNIKKDVSIFNVVGTMLDGSNMKYFSYGSATLQQLLDVNGNSYYSYTVAGLDFTPTMIFCYSTYSDNTDNTLRYFKGSNGVGMVCSDYSGTRGTMVTSSGSSFLGGATFPIVYNANSNFRSIGNFNKIYWFIFG